MPIKSLGSLGKIRVGRVTGNTHIFFFGLMALLVNGIFFLVTQLSLILEIFSFCFGFGFDEVSFDKTVFAH